MAKYLLIFWLNLSIILCAYLLKDSDWSNEKTFVVASKIQNPTTKEYYLQSISQGSYKVNEVIYNQTNINDVHKHIGKTGLVLVAYNIFIVIFWFFVCLVLTVPVLLFIEYLLKQSLKAQKASNAKNFHSSRSYLD